MTGTTPKPDPSDLDLDAIVRWRDHAEEFGPEEYGFEDDAFPDDFIHGEVTVAWTEYDSSPGSVGFLLMRTGDGRTWLRFATDDEPYPGEAGEDSVDMGPAVDDEISARELIQLMDRFTSPYLDNRGYVQGELASGEAISREERVSHRAFLMRMGTISNAATAWYEAVADHWVATGELVYLDAAVADAREQAYES